MNNDELKASVTASRAAQGLPPTVTDPGTLERVAAILRLSDKESTSNLDVRLLNEARRFREEQRMKQRRCALYRHFDTDGVLLYVGYSVSLSARRGAHANGSPWIRFAASETAEWLDSKEEAAIAEKTAIENEHPLFNRKHNGTDRRDVVAYLIKHDALDLLTWTP